MFDCIALASQEGENATHNLKLTRQLDYETKENKQLISHLEFLSSKRLQGRKVGTPGHIDAQSYIASFFTVKNTNQRYQTQEFTYSKGVTSKKGVNHIFTQVGDKYPDQVIVVTAHYDHLGKKGNKVYAGADDNASGTAALLAIKSWLDNTSISNTIVLVATDAEEEGLKGATAFLDDPSVNLENIKINLNLDMISYGYRKKGLILSGAKKQKQLAPLIDILIDSDNKFKFYKKRYLQDTFISSVNSKIDLHKASDHYEFYKKGIPYILLTSENHHRYHQPTDKFENVDLEFFQESFAAIKQVIVKLDQYYAK
ncbi:M28 family peptidase [Thalassotalea crassostreae]|uniref:M28 family peptidase n=1 Tax=Thalassotalea crassostreae TaxID=1763536 RepID=UPI0008381172|nr:M28 family peptidase [Thalassotalea crassostreae]